MFMRQREKIQKMPRQISVEKKPANRRRTKLAQQEALRAVTQENKDLKKALRQKQRELDLFIKAGKTLSATLEFKKVLQVVLSAARRLVRCEDWSLLLLSPTQNTLHYALAKTAVLKDLKKRQYVLGEGPAGWVAQKGKPLLIQDFLKQQRHDAVRLYPHLTARSALCLPILVKNQVIGVIQLINRIEEAHFTENDLQLLEKLLDQSTLAIERSDVFQKMSDLVTTDDLTHLYNLRYLDRVLEVEMKRSRRYKSSLALIFIDLDYFKQVNDNHGHIMGSQVLVEIADILVESLRAVDVIVRYGGDEFVVLLPNTPLKKATRVAERVRVAIRDFKFLQKEGLALHIAASFGIASYPEHAKNRTDLIHLADRAMYESKKKGRDMVSIANK